MQQAKILILPGDGIGPEVCTQAVRVLEALRNANKFACTIEVAPIGGASIDACGEALTAEVLDKAGAADALILGAVGGPNWDNLPAAKRPEKALLKLRSSLNLFANLRPAILYPSLAGRSSLRPNLVTNLDIMIVRELTGGAYFGTPRGIENREGTRHAVNSICYSEPEIERILRVAFKLASQRNKRLCSVDKANVLEVSMLWREIAERVHKEFPDIELCHLYVDNAAMQLVKSPKQFDVIVTENMFGDILSDLAAMLTGSIGMLPSASLNSKNLGLYEPVHGSAPDIANQGLANPIAAILCVAMMMHYTFKRADLAEIIDQAVRTTLDAGGRTADLASLEDDALSCEKMGEAILKNLRQQL